MSLNSPLPVQIWTTDSKLKIQEGFKSVIQIWGGGRQLKFINFGPWGFPILFNILEQTVKTGSVSLLKYRSMFLDQIN